MISKDQIFLYKRNKVWIAPKGYCFVKPLKAIDQFNIESEKPLQGIVKYSDGTVKVNDQLSLLQGELKDAYGTDDINIQDGTIRYPENGETDKKD